MERSMGSTSTMNQNKENHIPQDGGKDKSESYISPSDAILSPATQKLAAFKGKKLGKGLKPQTLFARAMTNSQMQNANNLGLGSPFPDVPKGLQQQSQQSSQSSQNSLSEPNSQASSQDSAF